MKETPPAQVAPRNNQPATSLVDRMDAAIGDASSVMGAMLTELLRRTLRGGVMQVGDELHTYAAEQVDATIAGRTPALERLAAEVAENTARPAATAVVKDEVQALERRATDSDRELAARIEETAKAARQTTAETSRELAGRIEALGQKAESTTAATTRELAAKIDEAEKRANESARAVVTQQIQALLQRSRAGTAVLQGRLQAVANTATGLTKQLLDEQGERRAQNAALQAEAGKILAALRRFQHEEQERWAGAERQRQALLLDLQKSKAALECQVDELRQAHRALAARVAELEKPRGWRAWLAWLRAPMKKRPPEQVPGEALERRHPQETAA